VTGDLRRRALYLGLALATVVAGLSIFSGAVPLGGAARDIAGDALWATMMTWLVAAIAPRMRLLPRGAVALAVCWVVELSQLVHGGPLDAVRSSTIGHLLLGSGFDPRDFLSYGLGVGAAMLLERSVRFLSVRSVRH